MRIHTIKLVYFSPTGTTRTIAEEISKGFEAEQVQHIECTLPQSRTKPLPAFQDELVILAAPVYAGRVAKIAADYFAAFTTHNTPAALAVVYGNRAYEDALRELHDIALNSGFTPIAAGAFIGEHSYSTEQKPIAHDRPDREDKQIAAAFGARIREKLQQTEDMSVGETLSIPGNIPYRERGGLPPMAPVTDASRCTLCGKCAQACPVEAISRENLTASDKQLCIHCCACIKICPVRARSMQHEMLQNLVNRLYTTCQARKEPELFL